MTENDTNSSVIAPLQPGEIALVVSTMEGRLWGNEPLVKQLVELGRPTVVVNQSQAASPATIPDEVSKAPHIVVLHSKELGVSNSRNAGIGACDASWCLLCDDDITLIPEGLNALDIRLKSASSRVAVVSTQLMKTTTLPWRNYPDEERLLNGRKAKRAIQNINSMELVVHRHRLNNADIAFNPRFGLGAPPTSGGEEVLLMNDVLERGLAIWMLPIATRVHPEVSSGSTWNERTAFSQGAVHRKVFRAPLRWVLFPWLVLKHWATGATRKSLMAYAEGWAWASRQR
jgi:glycosyltransferase involved in cell wall biosynthesis